jgi:cold shock protein
VTFCDERGRVVSSFDSFASADQGFQTEAVVKWFNLAKGFGFVAPVDGSSDAFLHSSVVSHAGMRDIAEGTKLLVHITDSPQGKGRQVASIVEVIGMSDVPPAPHGRPAPSGPEVDMSGTVKWFKPDKGFGFVTPDDGDRDVFVHRTVVQRAGMHMLESGQKLRMRVQTASKGREATWIEQA